MALKVRTQKNPEASMRLLYVRTLYGKTALAHQQLEGNNSQIMFESGTALPIRISLICIFNH
jgi:hypothetical protein